MNETTHWHNMTRCRLIKATRDVIILCDITSRVNISRQLLWIHFYFQWTMDELQQFPSTGVSVAHFLQSSNRKAWRDCTKVLHPMSGAVEVPGDSILCCKYRYFFLSNKTINKILKTFQLQHNKDLDSRWERNDSLGSRNAYDRRSRGWCFNLSYDKSHLGCKNSTLLAIWRIYYREVWTISRHDSRFARYLQTRGCSRSLQSEFFFSWFIEEVDL